MRHKYRHTNHHAAASLPFKFVPAPLGATHDTNATRPTTSTTVPPYPPPTRCADGPTPAVACKAEYFFRVVVVASSSVVRLGHTGMSRNAATNRKRSGPCRTATRGVPERSESGDLRTCLVAFPRCDAAAGRPSGCEHFPCLGHSCMTPGRAINHLEQPLLESARFDQCRNRFCTLLYAAVRPDAPREPSDTVRTPRGGASQGDVV